MFIFLTILYDKNILGNFITFYIFYIYKYYILLIVLAIVAFFSLSLENRVYSVLFL